MSMTMHLDVVSVEREIFSGTVTYVAAPGVNGEMGILPRHSQLIAKLRPGEVRATAQDGQELVFYVSGGVIEVQPHVVTVLSDTAARAQDLDEAAAQAAKERAERAMKDRQADFDYARAMSEYAEAVAQLAAIQRLRKRGH
jgi:F-type H+-transporting ATPase subunit epsilon